MYCTDPQNPRLKIVNSKLKIQTYLILAPLFFLSSPTRNTYTLLTTHCARYPTQYRILSPLPLQQRQPSGLYFRGLLKGSATAFPSRLTRPLENAFLQFFVDAYFFPLFRRVCAWRFRVNYDEGILAFAYTFLCRGGPKLRQLLDPILLSG